MKEMDDIEQLFASTFDGAEMAPPSLVKEGIDEALFAQKGGGGNLRIVWLLTICCIVLGGIATVYFMSFNTKNLVGATRPYNDEAIEIGDKLDLWGRISSEEGKELMITESLDVNSEEAEVNSNERGISLQSGHVNAQNKINANQTFAEKVPTVIGGNKNRSLVAKRDDTRTGEDLSLVNQKLVPGQNNVQGVTKSFSPDLHTSSSLSEGDAVFSSQKNTRGLINNEARRAAEVDAVGKANDFSSKNELTLFTRPPTLLEAYNLEKEIHMNQSQPTPSLMPPQKGNKLSLSLFSGGTFGHSSLKSDSPSLTIKEGVGYYGAVEVSYPLSSRFTLSAGLDYGQRKEKLTQTLEKTDSVVSGSYYQQIPPPAGQPDSLADSILVVTYKPVVATTEFTSTVKELSIGIPVYFTYTKSIGRSLALNLGIGARFSFEKYRIVDPQDEILYPTFKQVGIRLNLRPEIVYRFNRFGIGLYGKLGYDVMNTTQWVDIKRRRLESGFGISLRYKL